MPTSGLITKRTLIFKKTMETDRSETNRIPNKFEKNKRFLNRFKFNVLYLICQFAGPYVRQLIQNDFQKPEPPLYFTHFGNCDLYYNKYTVQNTKNDVITRFDIVKTYFRVYNSFVCAYLP